MRSLAFVVLVSMVALPGCNTIQNLAQIPLACTPKPHPIPELANKTFSLDVQEVRLYVTSGAKATSYVGIAHSGLYVHHDLFNAKKVALDEQLKGDLRKGLDALGLVESSAPGAKRIVVRVRDFNGDTYLKRRFTYDVELTVLQRCRQTTSRPSSKGRENL